MADPLKIFLAEDNYPDVLYIKQLLLRSGVSHSLETREDGELALEFLREAEEGLRPLPDLVLLDIKLPKYSGLEILEIIRQKKALQKLPVVIVTGSDDPDDLGKTYSLNASYVKKPADLEKMCQILSLLEHACFSLSSNFAVTAQFDNDVKSSFVENPESNKETFSLLLVEDNPHDVRLTLELLKRAEDNAHFEVEAVADIATASEFLKNRSFDVIALDLGLPDSEGLDGFKALHAVNAQIPVVIVTGHGEQELGKDAIAIGAQDFVVKNSDNYGQLLVRSLKYAIHRKRAELLAKETLMNEHRVLQEALAKAPIFIIRTDTEFCIIDVNSTTESEFGTQKKSLFGKNILTLVPEIGKDDLAQLVLQGVPFHRPSQAITKIGEKSFHEKYWDLLGWPVLTSDGLVREAIILAIDVSEKVRASQQRDEFVQTLAHDIKNPMLGEQWLLQGLLKQHGSKIQPSAVASGLQEVFRSNQSLVRMLTNLLDAYRFEGNLYNPFVSPLEISDILSDCLVEVSTLINVNNIQVSTKIDPSVNIFYGDKVACQRLLLNILHNAIKYTPPRGHIDIAVDKMADKLKISISDNGPGITIEDQKNLFQRFSCIDRSKHGLHGSGLGLYICKRIVEAHKGEITCTSVPDKGTTFSVILPLQMEPSPLVQVFS